MFCPSPEADQIFVVVIALVSERQKRVLFWTLSRETINHERWFGRVVLRGCYARHAWAGCVSMCVPSWENMRLTTCAQSILQVYIRGRQRQQSRGGREAAARGRGDTPWLGLYENDSGGAGMTTSLVRARLNSRNKANNDGLP